VCAGWDQSKSFACCTPVCRPSLPALGVAATVRRCAAYAADTSQAAHMWAPQLAARLLDGAQAIHHRGHFVGRQALTLHGHAAGAPAQVRGCMQWRKVAGSLIALHTAKVCFEKPFAILAASWQSLHLALAPSGCAAHCHAPRKGVPRAPALQAARGNSMPRPRPRLCPRPRQQYTPRDMPLALPAHRPLQLL
jgi:hypothetical protein